MTDFPTIEKEIIFAFTVPANQINFKSLSNKEHNRIHKLEELNEEKILEFSFRLLHKQGGG